jgi:uncharacterized membrane protein
VTGATFRAAAATGQGGTLEIFEEYGIEALARYGHILAGITWIGLLYYFNFVQTPAFAAFEAGPRNEAFAKLVPRAMWWFRWGAMATLFFGLLIFGLYSSGDIKPYDEMKAINVLGILAGMYFAIIMFSNVWFVIWPAQKRAIANAQNVLAGREADAGLPPVMRRAATASRTNTFLSIPMLFFMVAAAHLLNGAAYDTSEGGKRGIWYIVILAVGAITEFIALSAPPVGSPQTKHLDDHKNTIIGGFVLTIILYLVMEGLFG